MRELLGAGALALTGCLLAASCGPRAAPQVFRSQAANNPAFTGERDVSVRGAEPDTREFGNYLRKQGFRVTRVREGAAPTTPYLVDIDGCCPNRWNEGHCEPLNISVNYLAYGRRVYLATILESEDCPTQFYKMVADEIAGRWHSAPRTTKGPSEEVVTAALPHLQCSESDVRAARDGAVWHLQGCGRQVACSNTAGAASPSTAGPSPRRPLPARPWQCVEEGLSPAPPAAEGAGAQAGRTSTPNGQTGERIQDLTGDERYFFAVQAAVKGHWHRPVALSEQDFQVLRAQVRVRISGDGELLEVVVVKGSGNELFDTAALAAVRDAAPFAPPPASLSQAIEKGVVFDFLH